ncbi:MAG: hypothetical protein KIS61_08085 [Candidatus Eremiobacteraeota bacterium]|nr:hypothetical protein [Candidatus Eremiobacteraeota bacterium]
MALELDSRLDISDLNQACPPGQAWFSCPETTENFWIRPAQDHWLLGHRDKVLYQADRHELPDALRREVHAYIATHSPSHLFIHAAAVQLPHCLLVLPARTYSGKSTLTKAFLDLGYPVLSDEFCVLQESRVYPFPRDLLLRDPDQAIKLPEPPPYCDLPPAIFSLKYQKDEPGLALQPLSAGQAVMQLIDNCVSARYLTPQRLGWLAHFCQKGVAFSGTRGDAALVAQLIIDKTKSEEEWKTH